MLRRLPFVTGVLVAIAISAFPANGRAEAVLGANKFDLLPQYLGYASGGDGSAAWVHVDRAMGRKAIFDARDAGFAFLRISASGFFPIAPGGRQPDVLPLWQANPVAFWHGVDAMFDDLDRAHMRLVPTLIWTDFQFPALAHETTADLIARPASQSRALAKKFITEFVVRYRKRPTILFYELTNELNLDADLNLEGRCRTQYGADPARCATEGNFTTSDIESFAHDMVAVLHREDPGRMVSSGFSAPRPSAAHLARRPEWATGGPDWTPDAAKDALGNLGDTQRDFDIASIHIYPKDTRFGAATEADGVRRAAEAAHRLHKKLFLGEFGDTGATPFMRDMAQAIDQGAADYAAVWIWEFYQGSLLNVGGTDASKDTLEPGIHQDVIDLLRPRRALPSGSPRVVLTWPLPCARVDRPTPLAAVASDGATAPKQVEYFLDGRSIGVVSTPPYRMDFDPRPYGARRAAIEVRATGRSGAQSVDRSEFLLNGASGGCIVAAE